MEAGTSKYLSDVTAIDWFFFRFFLITFPTRVMPGWMDGWMDTRVSLQDLL
jgi:hypothetical protein